MQVYMRREPVIEDITTYFRAPTAVHVSYTNILGFKGGISLPTPALIKGKAEIIGNKNDVEIICKYEEIERVLNEVIEKFKEFLGIKFEASIYIEVPSEIFENLKNHVIASSVASTLNTINLLLRRPLDFRGLRTFLMDLGRKTHSGYALLIQDGSLVTSTIFNSITATVEGEILISKKIPSGIYGVIVELSEEKNSGYPIKKMIESELSDKATKLAFILERLYPTLSNFDINAFGDRLATLHFLGSKFAEIYSYGIMSAVSTLRRLKDSGLISLFAVPSFYRVALLISENYPIEHSFNEIFADKYSHFNYFEILSEEKG